MADQGKWWKLWISAASDPNLCLLPIADYGRWCKLGVYTKQHGTNGVVSLSKPSDPSIAHPLQSAFQVDTFSAIIDAINRFPNIEVLRVENETLADVSFCAKWRNWRKYQKDFSTDRVKQFRKKSAQNETQMKRAKKRGEEKRGEEKRELKEVISNSPVLQGSEPAPKDNGFSGWPVEWKPILGRITTMPFLAKYQHWLTSLDWWKSMDELFSSCPKNLDGLLTEAAAYCQTEGYRPTSKAGILRKLRNCMEFSAKKAERDHAEQRRIPGT